MFVVVKSAYPNQILFNSKTKFITKFFSVIELHLAVSINDCTIHASRHDMRLTARHTPHGTTHASLQDTHFTARHTPH